MLRVIVLSVSLVLLSSSLFLPTMAGSPHAMDNSLSLRSRTEARSAKTRVHESRKDGKVSITIDKDRLQVITARLKQPISGDPDADTLVACTSLTFTVK